MCSKRLGPQGEVGDTVVFARLFVSPTPSGGWDRVGTTGEVGTERRDESRAATETLSEDDRVGGESGLMAARSENWQWARQSGRRPLGSVTEHEALTILYGGRSGWLWCRYFSGIADNFLDFAL